MKALACLILLLLLTGCRTGDSAKNTGAPLPQCPHTDSAWAQLRATASEYAQCLCGRLAHLHDTVPAPGATDWLAQHKEEGQTFVEYSQSSPTTFNRQDARIYLRMIGDFTPKQARIIQEVAEYLSLIYGTSTIILDTLSLEAMPAQARRKHPAQQHEQLLSTYILSDILQPQLPADAALVLAFTTTDLYPSPQWNYVFGQASLRGKVGVWSIYRFGNPEMGEQAYNLCLMRALKTASHEAGHILYMKHCTSYHCNMGGSNNLDELDRKPTFFCPECLGKVCWNLGLSEIGTLQNLRNFWKKRGFKTQMRHYEAAIEALQN